MNNPGQPQYGLPGVPPPQAYPGPPLSMPYLRPPPMGVPPHGMLSAFPPPAGLLSRPPAGHLLRPPPVLRPPGPNPVVLPKPAGGSLVQVTPSHPAAAKSTTLYVGKIAPTVEDSVVRGLLEACGTLKSWKRVQDPDTGKPKAFGFCEFEGAEGVLRALRLLSNVKLDGQELLLKCNTATQKYVEEFEARKQTAAAKSQGGDATTKDGTAPATSSPTDEEIDNKVLEKIMTIVSDRVGPGGASAAATDFLSTLHDERSGRGNYDRKRRDKETAERGLDREIERQRERERQEQEQQRREQDRIYRDRLREWERYERDREKEAEKERQKDKEVEKERLNKAKAALQAEEEDDDVEPWRRKPYHTSRRAEERRRKRQREEEEDAADRAKDVSGTEPPRTHRATGLGHTDNGPSLPGAPPMQRQAREVDPNDPIYQAMIAAAKATPRAPSPEPVAPAQTSGAPTAASTSEHKHHLRHQPNDHNRRSGAEQPARSELAAMPAAKPAGSKRNTALIAAFGVDDDEDKPRRVLKPLQYTEEETKALQASAAATEEKAEPVADAPKAADAQADPKEQRKALMNSIPSTKDALFAYQINWDAFDAAKMQAATRISAYVNKKLVEVMGDEASDLADYVMEQLSKHTNAPQLLEGLEPLLDEEAEPFVMKLMRTVIYETEKQARGLA